MLFFNPKTLKIQLFSELGGGSVFGRWERRWVFFGRGGWGGGQNPEPTNTYACGLLTITLPLTRDHAGRLTLFENRIVTLKLQ